MALRLRLLALALALMTLAALVTLVTLVTTWVPRGVRAADGDFAERIGFAFRVMGLSGAGKSRVEPQKELKVIGAGLSRTGTKSQKAALEALGFKVLHMDEAGPDAQLTRQVVHGLTSDVEFEKLVQLILAKGFNATVDAPMGPLAVRLSKRFPNAKVILSVRDSPQQWAASMKALNWAFAPSTAWPLTSLVDMSFSMLAHQAEAGFTWVRVPCENSLWRFAFWYDCVDTMKLSKREEDVYVEWNDRVRRNIQPASRLLEFHVKHGWDPLVKFLGLPKPDMPFPHINESESLAVIGYVLRFINFAWPLFVVVGVLVWALVGEKLMRGIRLVCGGGRKRNDVGVVKGKVA